MYIHIYIYIYIYIFFQYVCIYIYIYIERERERERDSNNKNQCGTRACMFRPWKYFVFDDKEVRCRERWAPARLQISNLLRLFSNKW